MCVFFLSSCNQDVEALLGSRMTGHARQKKAKGLKAQKDDGDELG
jgi:hypothetical protein